MSCRRPTDNAAWGCPPRMSDGRLFLDARPRCDTQLEFASSMAGTHDYRQFLVHHGDKVREANRAAAHRAAACGPCKGPFEVSTMLPECDRFVCDKVSCKRVPGAPGGLGTGRQYGGGGSDWERAAAQVQKQQAREAGARPNCCARDADPAYFSMLNANVSALQSAGDVRWAVPGGGAPLSGGTPSMGCAPRPPV